MSFRQDIKDRHWLVRGDGQTTHLLMDGTGKLCVPDTQAGLFLNLYFAAAVVRGESISVVEQKSPIFRLFFDLDIRLPEGTDTGDSIKHLSISIWKFVTREFFILESTGDTTTASASASSTTESGDDVRDRMIVCTAPLKIESPGTVKAGCHIVFPYIYVNSPIALKCRDALLREIQSLYASIPESTSAQSVSHPIDSDGGSDDESTSCWSNGRRTQPLNSWSDVVDDSVYKGSGLRLVWSHKGRSEARAYVPSFEMTSVAGMTEAVCESLAVKREYVHLCSIRTTVGTLTPCRDGAHQIADPLNGHMERGTIVSGRSHSIDMYIDAIPEVERALPSVYHGIRFVKAFVTPGTVYLKTNSRYCLNVKREHRTSTIYIAVTRHGMMVRCYSRKEEYCCAEFASPIIPLPTQALRVFFPDMFEHAFLETSSKKQHPLVQKRRRHSSASILDRSPLFQCTKKK